MTNGDNGDGRTHPIQDAREFVARLLTIQSGMTYSEAIAYIDSRTNDGE